MPIIIYMAENKRCYSYSNTGAIVSSTGLVVSNTGDLVSSTGVVVSITGDKTSSAGV